MGPKRDQRPYNVAYYRAHREEELERVKDRQRKAVEVLRELRRMPCADRGSEFTPYLMDFDHKESGGKSFWLLQRAGSVSHARLIAELEKCDIVCANCHRAHTHARALERRRARIESGHVATTEADCAAPKPSWCVSCAMCPVLIVCGASPSSRWTPTTEIQLTKRLR